MLHRKEYSIAADRKSHGFRISIILIPLIMISLIFLLTGLYSFISANKIMRNDPKKLEDFANNILPSYVNTSFPSLDGVTTLSGWFFETDTNAISTVVMVHDYGQNRLQFDAQTAAVYDFFVNHNYNVLSFDLRHSGKSDGNLSSFGYAEWADVLAALEYVKKINSTDNIILYGFGSGVSACLIALESLNHPELQEGLTEERISQTGLDISFVKGMILDTPLASSDDYVIKECLSEILLGKIIGRHTIPYAVRLSAKVGRAYNLAAIIARTQIPVHIIYDKNESAFVAKKVLVFANERQRLFPNLTTAYEQSYEETLSNNDTNLQKYLMSIEEYLSRYFG